MQQPPQMLPMMHSFPPTNITTEQIQKYLDENKKLILAILDNQNLGKLAECAHKPLEYPSENISYKYEGDAMQWYQAQLQKNLMYLAAIADAQPQAPAMPPQMAPHPAMQQGGYYMPHPQATAMAQQPGFFPSKMPLQFGNPHHMQDSHQQLHQQGIQGQMGMRPIGSNNGLHPSQSHHLEASLVGQSAGQSDVRVGNKRDSVEVGAASTDGAGGSGAGQSRGEGEEPK